MSNPPRFTRDFLRQEIVELYRLMGERSFWRKPDATTTAVKALGFVYLRTDGLTQEDLHRFETVVRELAMRESLLLTCPPPWMSEAVS